MMTRLTDMSGAELWRWYTEQPQDSASTLSILRDIVHREAVIEVEAKMQARREAMMSKLYGEIS